MKNCNLKPTLQSQPHLSLRVSLPYPRIGKVLSLRHSPFFLSIPECILIAIDSPLSTLEFNCKVMTDERCQFAFLINSVLRETRFVKEISSFALLCLCAVPSLDLSQLSQISLSMGLYFQKALRGDRG